jgi:hypothetical protein
MLLNATTRQEILAHRDILIKGLTNVLDLGINSFDLMGVPRERILNMEDELSDFIPNSLIHNFCTYGIADSSNTRKHDHYR